MEFIAALVLALVSAWAGACIQASRVRRHWQTEMGATAWQHFVQGLHAWRAGLDEVTISSLSDSQRAKVLKRMREHLWQMSPDAPALHVFAPPKVNQAAFALLALADDITSEVESGGSIEIARVEQFDRQKWEFVVLAAGHFGVR